MKFHRKFTYSEIGIGVYSVDLETGNVSTILANPDINSAVCNQVYVHEDILFFAGIFDITVDGIEYIDIGKYDLKNQKFLPIDNVLFITVGIFAIVNSGNELCLFGGFDFVSHGQYIHNAVCSN